MAVSPGEWVYLLPIFTQEERLFANEFIYSTAGIAKERSMDAERSSMDAATCMDALMDGAKKRYAITNTRFVIS
jgi:hypothetical protein